MKVPVSWLKEYVDIDDSAEGMAERLTFSGTEVEEVEHVGSDYAGIVVAEIKEKLPHPAADSLHVCVVDDGTRQARVVCGAPDFTVGDKAPFAAVGVTLPGGMRIKSRKIRGELSEGMLCAEDELGISDDHSNIMLLPRDLPAGTPFAEIAGPPDTVLGLEVTWNRPDCLSVIGLARELAALYRVPLRKPSVEFDEQGGPVQDMASVRVDDSRGCPRYTARVIQGIGIGPSPMWMQRRLTCCGVRPISNVVDITNYVMLECGQPLHAFDYRFLKGHRIIVRRAASGETMRTLDDVERELAPDMMVIADADTAVAVAGVMGGAGSEIADDTSTVLLESACFDPASIASTSSRLGLSTESSCRFERTVDIGGVDWASRRAVALMLECAGGSAARGVIDVGVSTPAARCVPLRFERCRKLLGIDLAANEIADILERLELSVRRDGERGATVQVPSFRPDLEIEADLIEEVARIHGLDGVPEAVPAARVVPDADESRSRALVKCRHDLLGLGLTEIMNYSFVSEALLDMVGSEEKETRVALPNPVSADSSLLRESLMPQMIETLGRNLARQVEDALFFEIGTVFRKTGKDGVDEDQHLALGLMGRSARHGRDVRKPVQPEEMFLWTKGLVEQLFKARRLGPPEFVPCRKPGLEPGWAVEVRTRGKPCGTMGLLSAAARHKWRMSEPVGVGELRMEPLLTSGDRTPELEPLPAFPAVSRDVALIVNESATHESIISVMRRCAPPELTSIDLFDIFRGEGIGKGKKSMAYSLTYRSLEKTLTDEEANQLHESIKKALENELDIDIR